MNDFEKLLFSVTDKAEELGKQASAFIHSTAETVKPIAEETISTATEAFSKTAEAVSDNLQKSAEASVAAADKENSRTVLQALSHHASKNMDVKMVEAMYRVSSHCVKGTPIFDETDNTEMLSLMLTALRSMKMSNHTYQQLTIWLIAQSRG